ncbi:MAG TPA: tetratricopeptide repeat protein [Streptosporangiaceae bacterium]|nr:tetratricopeptide repeat protein [Streptosporangiaceae bacterium]
MSQLRVRLLGPVEVEADGRLLPVSGVRRKAVLAALALGSGEIVSTSDLVDAVWGEAAPATAVRTLSAHVSYLRHLMAGSASIIARPPGYVLDLGVDGADGTDIRLAERLLRQGTQVPDPADGVADLQAALDLWRGRPLADLAGHVGPAWHEQQTRNLDVLLAQVRLALFEARLAADEHALIVPGLEEMAAEHPLDEHVVALLMLALYRSGRWNDAIAVYRRLRETLSAQAGIEPGQRLQALETAILERASVLDRPPATLLEPAVRRVPVPSELPRSESAFTGRVAELASLDAVLSEAVQASPVGPDAVAVIVISGTAGIGKTALAVHWARQVASQFPDGQLYIDLRGFDADDRALDPGDVLWNFLRALGIPAARLPLGNAERAALYRSVLVGKRVLAVLDNAKDADQVRPLLPSSPGCLVIVTSRSALTSLIAVEGARPVSLDLLTEADASDLLARRLGEERLAAEPVAADDIIAGCAGLPLSLTIVAARLAAKPGSPLATVAGALREAVGTLDAFDDDDLAVGLRTLFSWSYRALSADAARMFRLLGLNPGPDLTLPAAASLAAISVGRARGILAELTRAHLLTEHRPGRYASHDLLHAYAAELTLACDSDQARDAAVYRLVDHYLHTAHAAVVATQPYHEPIALGAARPGITVAAPVTEQDGLQWFTDECVNALAAVELAAGAELNVATWQLAWALSAFLLRQGRWSDQERTWQAGLDAARRAGDQAAEAVALHGLAGGYHRSGRGDLAYPLFVQALEAFERIGGYLGRQANIHSALGDLAGQDDRPADMLGHCLRSRELYQQAADSNMQVGTLNNIGYSYALLGDYQQALEYCERAVAGARDLGERNWESYAAGSLGFIHHQLGDYPQAADWYERAAVLCREVGERYFEANSLECLGDVQRDAGDLVTARRTWERALSILDEIHHPGSERVRARLA